MAEAGPNVGFATLSIIPSLRGAETALAGQLAPVEAAAAKSGTKAGSALAGNLGKAVKVGMLGVAGVIAGVGVAAIASAKGVEDANNIIIRATGASGAAAEALEQSFKNVAKTTPASFETVATALAEVSQRTGLTGTALELLTRQTIAFNRISKDAPIGVQELTKALAGFGVPAEKMSESFDQLFKTSQKTGVPITELIAAVTKAGPIFRQFGLNAAQTGGLLGQLDKAGIESSTAIAGLRAAFNKFAKAGVAPEEGLKKTLKAIQELLKAGDETGANKLANQIFGGRGVGLVDAAKQGKLSLDSLSASFATTGDGILETAKKTGTVSGKLGVLKNNLALALAPLGKPLLDAANAGLGALVGLVQKAGDVIGPVLRDIGEGFQTFLAAFKAGGDDVTSSGVSGAIERLGLAAREVFDFISKNWKKIGAILAVGAAAQIAIVTVIVDHFDELKTAAVGLFDAFIEALKPVIDAVKEALPAFIALAKDGFKVMVVAATILGAIFLKVIVPALEFLLPIVGKVLATFIKFAGFLAKNRAVLVALLAPLATVAVAFAAFAAVSAVIAAVTTAFEALGAAIFLVNLLILANPFVAIAVAVGILAAGLVIAFQKVKPFRTVVLALFDALKTGFAFVLANWKLFGAVLLAPFLPFIAIVTLIIKNWSTLVTFFKGVIDAIVGFFTEGFGTRLVSFVVATFNNIVQIFTGVFNVILGLVKFFIAVFTGDWSGAWQAIVQVVSGVWAIITGIIGQALNQLQFIFTAGFAVIKAQVLAGVKAIGDFFGTLPGRIAGIALSVAVAAFNLGKGIITGLVNGITGAVGVVADIGKAISNAIARFVNSHVIDAINDALDFEVSLGFLGKVHINPPDIPHLPTFATGGIVPGTGPVLAVVHGGETITPPGQSSTRTTTVNLFGSTVTAEDITREVRWLQLTGTG